MIDYRVCGRCGGECYTRVSPRTREVERCSGCSGTGQICNVCNYDASECDCVEPEAGDDSET